VGRGKARDENLFNTLALLPTAHLWKCFGSVLEVFLKCFWKCWRALPLLVLAHARPCLARRQQQTADAVVWWFGSTLQPPTLGKNMNTNHGKRKRWSFSQISDTPTLRHSDTPTLKLVPRRSHDASSAAARMNVPLTLVGGSGNGTQCELTRPIIAVEWRVHCAVV